MSAEQQRGTKYAALVEDLQRLAAEAAESCGVELVDLVLRGSGSKRLVRVDIDRAGAEGVDLEDCRRVSAALDSVLEEDERLERFVLEVSSPGLDRPIRSDDDFRRNTGRRVSVSTRSLHAERSRFAGRLAGRDGVVVMLHEDELGELRIEIDDIEKMTREVRF